tara:strand:- start:51921 stop:52856 length:936 start_codon:yes stop_codon:yes gene_type:complete
MDILFTTVIPIFALIGCGFLAGKLKFLGPESTKALSGFVYMFALPGLLILSIGNSPITEILNGNFFAAYSLGMVIVWGISAIVSVIIFRDNIEIGTIRAVNSTYGNTGYLGIPLGIAIFGEIAIVPASISVAINAFLIIPMAAIFIEVARNSGRGFASITFRTLKTLLVNPIVLSVLIGFLLSLSEVSIPSFIEEFLDILGGAAGPCALFAIGLFVSQAAISRLLLRLALLSIVKLLFFPVIVWFLVTWVFPLDLVWGSMAVLMAATPLGATAFVISERYKVSVEESSAAVVVTTGFSVFTLSIIIMLLTS